MKTEAEILDEMDKININIHNIDLAIQNLRNQFECDIKHAARAALCHKKHALEWVMNNTDKG